MDINQLLLEKKCCKRCVGRLYPISNNIVPNSSILQAEMKLDEDILEGLVDEINCEICQGSVIAAIDLTSRLLDKLKTIEFSTFLVGCSLTKNLEASDQFLSTLNPNYCDLKSEIRNEVSLRIAETLNVSLDYGLPEVSIVIDTKKNRYQLDIRSIYILGRYKKLTRGLPQTKWPCSKCRGRGCASCNNSGQQYPKTVETVISPYFVEQSGSKASSFHGAGREDIDALMLGTGRPFVLELKSPIVRNIDLQSIEIVVNQQNDVKLTNLQFCEKDVIITLKQGSPDAFKSYRALVKLEGTLTEEMIEKINKFGKAEQLLNQRTPTRVSHRRADLIRSKSIFKVKASPVDDQHFELHITAQGGAYIKEFISGDNGRTQPSISSIIKCPVVCLELDVTAVDDRGVFSS